MIFLRKSLLRIYKIEQMRVDKKCLFKNQFSWTWLILKDQAQNFIFQGFHILWQEKCNILLCQNKVPGNLKKRFFIFNCKTKIRRFFCICRNGCLFLWFPASEAEGDWNIIWVLNKAGDSRDSSKRIFIARRTTGARAASSSGHTSYYWGAVSVNGWNTRLHLCKSKQASQTWNQYCQDCRGWWETAEVTEEQEKQWKIVFNTNTMRLSVNT